MLTASDPVSRLSNRRRTGLIDIIEYPTTDASRCLGLLHPDVSGQLTAAAVRFCDCSVIHINTIAYGGGVAEIMHSLAPLSNALGSPTQRLVITPEDSRFFGATKRIHNMLQGAPGELSDDELATYYGCLDQIAGEIDQCGLAADVWFLHDPQLLPLARLLVTQVSRFDAWKDPWDVIDAYRLARKSHPALQLDLLGLSQANDDPEGEKVLNSVRDYSQNDPDLHLFFSPQGLPPTNDEIGNALQTHSQVIVQKSTREGFGLTVSEATWNAKPVIGGSVGYRRRQIVRGESGYLSRLRSRSWQPNGVAALRSPAARVHRTKRQRASASALPAPTLAQRLSARRP